ncbi:flagellin [Hafnia paralvei]|uniref:flagellin N-terminal helical domain-containing protein n=1 Tax=Hafnia paralvei TaxID=546367 RepID=UPI001C046E9C|nr:flagellin [Hafnia paralvei]MBU2674551.1 flagellin FliC [Hafnia paralvei]
MAQVINTNSLSLMAQNNLNKSQSSLGTAIERLSSGLRINSAKDDAAGQAISNRFTANIKGLTQASRNANDGISLAQTTEGALNEVNDNLQNIRRLTVQSQNGSNSSSDLQSIQDEISQRLSEINRISEQTDFNGVKVLSGDQKLTIQVGANDNETIDIDLKDINAKTLGLDKFTVATPIDTANLGGTALTNIDVTGRGAIGVDKAAAATVNFTDDGKIYKDDNGDLFVKGTNTYTAGAATAGTAIAGAKVYTDDTGALFVGDGTNYHAAKWNATSKSYDYDQTAAATPGANVKLKAPEDVYYKATQDATTGVYDFTTKATADVPVGTPKDVTSSVPVKQTLDLSDLNKTAGITDEVQSYTTTDKNGKAKTDYMVVSTAADGSVSYAKANIDSAGKVTKGAAMSTDKTADPLAVLDKALSQVDGLRSSLGAVQNRFDSVINNLNSTVNNLTASQSRIQDADYATEVSNMSRANILQQAGTSVLAQANQSTQNVLTLLR